MKTMEDLRRGVAERLRASLHGKEIDMLEDVRPELPHMLGVTPLNKQHDSENENKTLMDPSHNFWDEYVETIETRQEVSEKLQTAIQSLRSDGLFRMTYPYGEEAEIVYVEVDRPYTQTTIQTSCKQCGHTLPAQPNLLLNGEYYHLRFSLDCPDCDFNDTVEPQ